MILAIAVSLKRLSYLCCFLPAIMLVGAQRPDDEMVVPPVLTPPEAVAEIIRLAALKPGDVLADLGCGDGRITIAAAKSRARAVCVERSPEMLALAKRNAVSAGVGGSIEFRLSDLRDYVKDAVALGSVAVVVVYLSPELNRRIADDLLKNLAPGAKVISHAYPVDGWKPKEIRAVRIPATGNTTRIYLYQVQRLR